MLSHEETQALLIAAKGGDGGAMDTLVLGNSALVKSIVRRYLGRGVEYEDLYQLGSVGLVKAIRNFDPAYQVRFSTYAVPMIAGEIKRFLRDDGPVKVGRSVKELAARAMAARERLMEQTGLQPGVQEIAGALGEDAADVAAALAAARPTLSLNESIGEEEEGVTRGERIVEEPREDRMVDRLLISALLTRLDEREKRIILLRYFRDCTQTRVAEIIGVSQVQVSRLESRILKKLRALAEGGG